MSSSPKISIALSTGLDPNKAYHTYIYTYTHTTHTHTHENLHGGGQSSETDPED